MQTSDAHSDPSHTSREGTVRATPIPPLDFDIMNEIELIHLQVSWQTGISLKKLVRYPDFRVSLTAMKAETRIEMHQNLGRISVQTTIRLEDGCLRSLRRHRCIVTIHDRGEGVRKTGQESWYARDDN